jgi:hypothetical protein
MHQHPCNWDMQLHEPIKLLFLVRQDRGNNFDVIHLIMHYCHTFTKKESWMVNVSKILFLMRPCTIQMKLKLTFPKRCSLRFRNCSLPEWVKLATGGALHNIVSRLLSVILKKVQLLNFVQVWCWYFFQFKGALTVLSSKMDSFHFQVVGSTFETTFFPYTMVRILWGIWSSDLSKMHLKAAIACTMCVCNLSKPEFPCFCADSPSAAYLA